MTHGSAYLCICCQPFSQICMRLKLNLPACSGGQIALSYFEHACVVTYRGAYLFSELSTYSKRWSVRCTVRSQVTALTLCRVCRTWISWSNAVEPVRPTWQLFSAPDPASKVLLLTQMLYRHIFLVHISYCGLGCKTRLFLYSTYHLSLLYILLCTFKSKGMGATY